MIKNISHGKLYFKTKAFPTLYKIQDLKGGTWHQFFGKGSRMFKGLFERELKRESLRGRAWDRA